MNIVNLVGTLPVHPKKKPNTRRLTNITKLVVHCTDWNVTPEALARYDIGKNHISSTGCPTITYHYLINQDGTVAKTVNHETVTWHAGGYNTESLAISLVYKTDPVFESGKSKIAQPGYLPTSTALTSLLELLSDLCLELNLLPTQVLGHRELIGTGFILFKGHKQLRKTCPGMSINLDQLRLDVAKKMQSTLSGLGIYTGILDGVFGKKSIEALKEYQRRGRRE